MNVISIKFVKIFLAFRCVIRVFECLVIGMEKESASKCCFKMGNCVNNWDEKPEMKLNHYHDG